MASICDPSYAASMTEIANKLSALIIPPCITQQIQSDGNGNPMCTVVDHVTDSSNNRADVVVPYCGATGGTTPCWSERTNQTGCSGVELNINDPTIGTAAAENTTVDCILQLPTAPDGGCETPAMTEDPDRRPSPRSHLALQAARRG